MDNQKRVEDGRLIRGPVTKKKQATGPCRDCAWYKSNSEHIGTCYGHDDLPARLPMDSCEKWINHQGMREYINHIITELTRLKNAEAVPNPYGLRDVRDPYDQDMLQPEEFPAGARGTITTAGQTNAEGHMINGIDVDAEIKQNDELLAEMLEAGKVRPELGDFEPEVTGPELLDPNGDLFDAAEREKRIDEVIATPDPLWAKQDE